MAGLRIFIATEGSGGVRLIKSLLTTSHMILGVLASPKDPSFTSVWNFAADNGLPTYESRNAKYEAFADIIRLTQADFLFSFRFPYIINSDVLSAPKLGAFNLHSGPLPDYAGLNSVSWAIYNGETRHGVTLHKIEQGIDTGPIAAQTMFNISSEDTALSITNRCIETGLELILEFVEKTSIKEDIKLHPQDLTRRHYYDKSVPNAGWIDWESPAKRISDFIRACDHRPFPSPWGAAKTIYGEEIVEVHRGYPKAGLSCNEKPGTIQTFGLNRIRIATGNGWYIPDLINFRGDFINPHLVLHKGGCFGGMIEG